MKRGRNQRRRQGININRALDSNGPEVRIRGTANQIHDKYLALARDANSAGDRVKAENYFQHAEHYFRLIRSIQPAQAPHAENGESGGDQPSVDSADESNQNGAERDSRSQGTPDSAARPDVAEKSEDSAEQSADGERGRGRRPRPRRIAAHDENTERGDGEQDGTKTEATVS